MQLHPQPCSRNAVFALLLVLSALCTLGCGRLLYRFSSPVPQNIVPNPALIPPANPDFVWSQVVDTVDDYFHVVREQPLQATGDLVLEGRLDTAYKTGSSLLEPWRKDSTKGFERLQSTFQSIRRRATVIVRPSSGGYSVYVQVDKEIEDVDREQFASESAASYRHDGTIVRQEDLAEGEPITLGWIALGRDASLEQQILQQILGRVTQPDQQTLLHH